MYFPGHYVLFYCFIVVLLLNHFLYYYYIYIYLSHSIFKKGGGIQNIRTGCHPGKPHN